jgi:hypothetical protein
LEKNGSDRADVLLLQQCISARRHVRTHRGLTRRDKVRRYKKPHLMILAMAKRTPPTMTLAPSALSWRGPRELGLPAGGGGGKHGKMCSILQLHVHSRRSYNSRGRNDGLRPVKRASKQKTPQSGPARACLSVQVDHTYPISRLECAEHVV